MSGEPPNLQYFPALNYHGSDHFTFKVHDGLSRLGDGAVDITVVGIAEIPAGIEGIHLEGGRLTITWNSVIGQAYRVRYSDSLSNPIWIPVSDAIIATGGKTSWSTPNDNRSPGFYTLEVVDP